MTGRGNSELNCIIPAFCIGGDVNTITTCITETSVGIYNLSLGPHNIIITDATWRNSTAI